MSKTLQLLLKDLIYVIGFIAMVIILFAASAYGIVSLFGFIIIAQILFGDFTLNGHWLEYAVIGNTIFVVIAGLIIWIVSAKGRIKKDERKEAKRRKCCCK